MGFRNIDFSFVRELGHSIRLKQNTMSQDIGHSGELLTARLRMVLIVILSVNPIKSTLLNPAEISNWVGLLVTAGAVSLAYSVTRLAARTKPPKSLPWLTSQMDVLAVSLAAVGFIVAGDPIVATNNFVHWSYYLFAIAATCLRHNPRLTLITVFSAVVQHLAIATYVAVSFDRLSSRAYGFFDWDTQIGKTVAMIIMGLLALSIVTRNSHLWESSVRDKLTGLHNRRFFDEFLSFKCLEYARHKQPFCLAMIDIDHFKKINDVYGHAVGDKVLTEMGKCLSDVFRSSDMTARWGGEEFAVILSDCDIKEAAERLEQFRISVVSKIVSSKVTVSIGVANFPDDAAFPDSLVLIADHRLLSAKRAGRNQTVAA